jgi:nucleotide-binding universal stress UspA family protein/CBS domain-containing protein
MFTRIVAGVDGSAPAEEAARAAIALAARNRAEVHLVSVVEELPGYVSAREEIVHEETEARRYFHVAHARLQKEAARQGVAATTHVLVGHEAGQLISYLLEVRADLLAIGHAGHSAVWGTALGSTAIQLLRHAPCSILIVRANTQALHFARLAIAFDGSPLGWEAYAVALDLAQHTRHPLSVLSVAEGLPVASSGVAPAAATSFDAPRSAWQMFLASAQARAVARAAAAGITTEMSTWTGPASEALVRAAHELSADLLILGATGHEHPWSQTAGGTATKVAEEASCAVLVVRPPIRGALVRDVMAPVSFVAHPHTPLAEVLSVLLEGSARLVPVVSSANTLDGIITLGHLLRCLDPTLVTHLTQKQELAHMHLHLDRLVAGQTARDAMLTRPYVLQPDVPLDVAGRYLTAHHITRVPVVDASYRLVGMLSEREIVAALIAPLAQPVDADPGSAGPSGAGDAAWAASPTAEILADRHALVLAESASADEVVRALQATRNHLALVVAPDGQLRGVIDERSLLRRILPHKETGLGAALSRFLTLSPAQALAIARGHRTEPLTAAALMHPIPTIPASMPVPDALARLITAQNSDVGVVVTPDNHPIGLLWRRAALRALVRG